MQSSASKRALSTLASKIHPQLPLSPRESQQLLTLLTNSFRAHLDRAHPLAPLEGNPQKPTRELTVRYGRRDFSPSRSMSSYASATQHIDCILHNPLFAVKPRRRGPGPAAIDILRDPISWFVDEIAAGSATLPKAAMCLEVLDKTTKESPWRLRDRTPPASVLAEWLRTSGLDTSKQFVDMSILKSARASKFLDRLVALLVAEGDTTALWRWLIRSSEQRAKDTGLDVTQIATFRQQLLAKMVVFEADTSLTSGLTVFMQAFRLVENAGYEAAYGVLRPAGGHLVNRIISNTDQSLEPELYQSFLLSSPRWLGGWSRAVESMLWLHHPSKPSTCPGRQFIQDPAGAIRYVNSSRSRRNFLVQLCLGVARQSMEQERFTEAQMTMEFTKEHFPDIVLPKQAVAEQQNAEQIKVRRERKNLELLDRLMLT